MISADNAKTHSVSSVNGQQTKWYENGKWYKLDQYGYESAAEAICADLNYALGVENYVEYRECKVMRNGFPFSACVSDDFTLPGYRITTLEELASLRGMRQELNNLSGTDPVQFLSDFLDITDRIVGIQGVHDYVLDLLWLDCLYYNIDRHINNFSFYVGEDIQFAPYYDFGEALFSDQRIFKGVENPANAQIYLDRWPMNPLKFPLRETVQALRHFKPFPYDMSALNHVRLSSDQNNILGRVQTCLQLTTKIILENA